jgi:hypothetical protein
MHIATSSAPEFGPESNDAITGEEIHILTLNPGQQSMLETWSRRLRMNPDEILLRAFDLLTERFERAEKAGLHQNQNCNLIFQP